jgi:hypothetical protein
MVRLLYGCAVVALVAGGAFYASSTRDLHDLEGCLCLLMSALFLCSALLVRTGERLWRALRDAEGQSLVVVRREHPERGYANGKVHKA